MGSSLFRTLRRVLVDVIIPCRGEAGLAQCVWHLGYGLGIPRNRVRFRASPIRFYFLSINRPMLRASQPSVQIVVRAVLQG
jgi:hypothetical protein